MQTEVNTYTEKQAHVIENVYKARNHSISDIFTVLQYNRPTNFSILIQRSDGRLYDELILGRIAVLRSLMRPIVTDRVVWSVGRSVTLVNPAKTAAPVKMPFGLRSRVGPRNHVLDGSPHSPMGKGNFEWENGCPIVKYRDNL